MNLSVSLFFILKNKENNACSPGCSWDPKSSALLGAELTLLVMEKKRGSLRVSGASSDFSLGRKPALSQEVTPSLALGSS